MGYFPRFLFFSICGWCTGMPLISEYWLCIPLFCQIHILGWVVFLVESTGFSMYTMYTWLYVMCKQWHFCFLLSHFNAFYFFLFLFFSFLLITVARVSNTMLNRSGESRHPCLVPGLHGKTFRFFPLSMILAVGLSYIAFIMLRNAPSIPTFLSVFIINGCYNLSVASSTSIDMIMWFLSLVLFMWCIMLIDLQILYHPCIPGMNPTWSCHMISLMYQ